VWDPVLVAALSRELRERLTGARLRALHLDPAGQRLLLFFREATLGVHLGPDDAGVRLTDPAEPIALSRPLASTLVSIAARPDDRILEIELRATRPPRTSRRIVLELMTNQSNALVLESDEDHIRHVLKPRDGQRALRRGLVYTPPPVSQREGVDGGLSFDRWRELLLPVEPKARRGALLSRVAWTSSINARTLLGEATTQSGEAGEAALVHGHALWLRLVDVARGVGTADGPVLLHAPGAAQPYPMTLPGERSEPMASLLAAFDAAGRARGLEREMLLPTGWVEALTTQHERLRARADSLSRELEGAPEPDAVRAVGDLLLARYREIPKGAQRATLVDFEGQPREVALDPTLTTHENAARYYERASRATRARERLPSLIESVRREALALEQLIQRARAGTADADEVLRVLPPEVAPRGAGAPALPYRRYVSSGGIEIRVGKGARQNDELTFKHASPEDVWLHARHVGGAHVVLRWQAEASPPAKDLMEAAGLAALHSRARSSSSVPVDWTRRKHVRKPRKSPPGEVVVERTKTVFVEPDETLEERLRGDRPQE
jgi:predicted ribosome quality control (RQC) complex YloA/Tae2 family protein